MLPITLLLTVFAMSIVLLPVCIWRWPLGTALVAVASASILDCLQVGNNGVELGMNLFLDDVAVAVLLFVGLLLLVTFRRNVPFDAIPCLTLLVLVAISFFRGASEFGLRPAGNSARNLIYFTVPALVLMLLGPFIRLDEERLVRWLVWAGSIYGLIAILRWAGLLPMPMWEGEIEQGREVVRALVAGDAFIIGLAFIAVLYLLITARSSVWIWAAVAFFGLETVFLQHRSVWVATAAGSGWLAIRTIRASPRRWFTLAAVSVAAMILAAFIRPDIAEKVTSLVVENIQETQLPDSTWAWRVEGYREATDRVFHSDATDMLVGPPAGWAANTDASFAATHIHSRYIDTLAYYGVLGFAALLFWLGVIVRRVFWPVRALRGGRGLGDLERNSLLQALLLSTFLFFVPYFGGIPHGAVLGLIWVAASQLEFTIPHEAFRLRHCLPQREVELDAQAR